MDAGASLTLNSHAIGAPAIMSAVVQDQGAQYGRRALAAAVLAHFTNDGNSIMFTVLIAYYVDMRMSLGYLGAAAAISNLISGLIAERIGFWADRSGRRGRLMALGIGLLSAACFTFGLSFLDTAYTSVLVIPGVALLGVGTSFYHPLGGSIIAFAVKGKALSRHMGVNGSFGSIGRAFFPTLIVTLVALLGAPSALFLLCATMAVIGAAIFFLSRGFDGLMVVERQKQPTARTPLGPYRRFIASLAAIFLVNAVFAQGVTTYITAYYEQVYGSADTAGLITSLILITPIVGQPVQGYLAERIGGRRTLQIDVVGSALVFTLFLVSHDAVVQAISLGGLAFFVYTGFPVILAYATLMTPRDSITRVNAIIWGFGSTIGSALGSSVGGTLSQDFGFHASFTISWLFGLAAIAMLPLVPNRIKSGTATVNDGPAPAWPR